MEMVVEGIITYAQPQQEEQLQTLEQTNKQINIDNNEWNYEGATI